MQGPPPHLWQSRHGVYYFRIVVPHTVRAILRSAPREIRRSLGTRCRKEALRLAQASWGRLYSHSEVYHVEETADVIINISERDRRSLTEGPHGYLYNIQSDYELAVLDYLKALYHNGVDRLRPEKTSATGGCITSRQGQAQAKPLMLADVIELYCQDKIAEGGWRPRTEAENRAIYEVLKEVVGAMAFSDIRRPHLHAIQCDHSKASGQYEQGTPLPGADCRANSQDEWSGADGAADYS